MEIIFYFIFALFLYFYPKYLLEKKEIQDFVRWRKILHPNSISYLRIPIAIIAIALWYFDYTEIWILLYLIACISDAWDGMIARKCWLETEYGKFLDPLSDKIVYFIPLFVFACIGEVSWIFVILLFLLDGFSQFSRIIIKKVSKKQQANMFGKIKTTLIFLFIFSLLLNFHFLDYFWYFWILSLSLGSIIRKVMQ